MVELRPRISYIKGLADGMELADTKEKKLMMEIIDVLEEMSDIIEDLALDVDETIDYVECIDEDLGDLEDNYYGEEDEFDDSDDVDDEDFDLDCLCGDSFCDDYTEVRCSNCDEVFLIDDDLDPLDDEGIVECPHCGADVELD